MVKDLRFTAILAFIYKCQYPTNINSYNDLYQKAGLIKHDITGNVAIYNVHLSIDNGYHMAPEACYKYKETFMLTYNNLNKVNLAKSDNNIVYIVENETVYSLLQKQIKDNTALICTSGQLSLTALKIIELLIKSDTNIYYSGDNDPEGISICDRLWQKYPNNIIPWHMDNNSYIQSISNENINSTRLSILDKIENPILIETSFLIQKNKKAGYQENIIDLYLADLNKKQ